MLKLNSTEFEKLIFARGYKIVRAFIVKNGYNQSTFSNNMTWKRFIPNKLADEVAEKFDCYFMDFCINTSYTIDLSSWPTLLNEIKTLCDSLTDAQLNAYIGLMKVNVEANNKLNQIEKVIAINEFD